ncbi:ABC transporter permease [Actinobacteria bacterium YIM 96077]|uniref:Transport permease protein n=1 Tax=Phytoactinopolyspora halophila TaxID=1981511 RepID=A0A329QNA3_9ACTN|nr:ABC transporter permease [Phytoactinopolyspora halophila]AYY12935.1 ABC transporter permease [Actinobacteria bacterium YIM 96077]RAW13199.1 ABC transporter permease [Phytoactinopolyspora halophila]
MTTTERRYRPAPGAAPVWRMLVAQTAFETRLLLRHGEQLLLTAVIPVTLLALLAFVPVIDTGAYSRLDFLVPGILALAVMSTSFTSLAIATGYERRYGVLKRLATTPLPRSALLIAKALTVLVVEALQVTLVGGLGAALGWRPTGSVLAVLALIVVGTLAFAGLGFLMAGTLRAEATLAAANLVYLLLLVLGGIIIPLDEFPDGVQPVLMATPAGALADGLRSVLADGSGLPWSGVAILAGWAVAGFAAAARWFRWE